IGLKNQIGFLGESRHCGPTARLSARLGAAGESSKRMRAPRGKRNRARGALNELPTIEHVVNANNLSRGRKRSLGSAMLLPHPIVQLVVVVRLVPAVVI